MLGTNKYPTSNGQEPTTSSHPTPWLPIVRTRATGIQIIALQFSSHHAHSTSAVPHASPHSAGRPPKPGCEALSFLALALLNQGPRVWALTGLSTLPANLSQTFTHVGFFIGARHPSRTARSRDATADFLRPRRGSFWWRFLSFA